MWGYPGKNQKIKKMTKDPFLLLMSNTIRVSKWMQLMSINKALRIEEKILIQEEESLQEKIIVSNSSKSKENKSIVGKFIASWAIIIVSFSVALSFWWQERTIFQEAWWWLTVFIPFIKEIYWPFWVMPGQLKGSFPVSLALIAFDVPLAEAVTTVEASQ